MNSKKYFFSIILTLIIIVIIIYLFATVEQSVVECSNSYVSDENIRVNEDIAVKFNGKKIDSFDVTKTIIVPNKYATDEYLNSLKLTFQNSLEYLDNVKYNVLDDRIIITIKASKDETVILKNIDFLKSDELQVKINSNTKSSDVITISGSDSYTEGEFMTRFKNNGYSCK